jgi:hypothetical protein
MVSISFKELQICIAHLKTFFGTQFFFYNRKLTNEDIYRMYPSLNIEVTDLHILQDGIKVFV